MIIIVCPLSLEGGIPLILCGFDRSEFKEIEQNNDMSLVESRERAGSGEV
jgi:hypothetical protein